MHGLRKQYNPIARKVRQETFSSRVMSRPKIAEVPSALTDYDDIVVHAPDGFRHIIGRKAFPNVNIVIRQETLSPQIDKKVTHVQKQRIVKEHHTLCCVKRVQDTFELRLERIHDSGIMG